MKKLGFSTLLIFLNFSFSKILKFQIFVERKKFSWFFFFQISKIKTFLSLVKIKLIKNNLCGLNNIARPLSIFFVVYDKPGNFLKIDCKIQLRSSALPFLNKNNYYTMFPFTLLFTSLKKGTHTHSFFKYMCACVHVHVRTCVPVAVCLYRCMSKHLHSPISVRVRPWKKI